MPVCLQQHVSLHDNALLCVKNKLATSVYWMLCACVLHPNNTKHVQFLAKHSETKHVIGWKSIQISLVENFLAYYTDKKRSPYTNTWVKCISFYQRDTNHISYKHKVFIRVIIGWDLRRFYPNCLKCRCSPDIVSPKLKTHPRINQVI